MARAQQAYTVTVVAPEALRQALEGRQQVQLGVPASATLGDVLETLLSLYPRLRRFLSTERRVSPLWLHLATNEHAMRELARGGSGLFDGQRLYLFCPRGGRRDESGAASG